MVGLFNGPTYLKVCFLIKGIKLPNKKIFDNFDRLRNGIQHFSSLPSDINISEETLKLIYEVISPFIYK